MKEFVPLDEISKINLNPYELVIVASKETRNINKVRQIEREQNPEAYSEDIVFNQVYIEALNKVLNNEVEFYY